MILAAESPVFLPVQRPVLEDALRNSDSKALVDLFSGTNGRVPQTWLEIGNIIYGESEQNAGIS